MPVALDARQWARLLDALELADRFVLLGVDVGNPAAEAAVVEGLRAWSAGAGRTVVELKVPLQDVSAAMRGVLAAAPAASEILVLTIPAEALVSGSAAQVALERFFALLNQKRDELARRSVGPVLLVLHAFAWKLLVTRAPDLFSIYHGFFRFDPIPSPEPLRSFGHSEVGPSLPFRSAPEVPLVRLVRAPTPPFPLLERTQELRFLRAALAEPGAVVVVVGEAGSGKSVLIDTFAREGLGFSSVVRVGALTMDTVLFAQEQVIRARHLAASVSAEAAPALYAEATRSARLLIVVDEVVDEDALIVLRPQSPSVLLAAARRAIDLGWTRSLRLGRLLEGEALRLLISQRAPSNTDEAAAAARLSSVLTSPVAVQLAADRIVRDDGPNPYRRALDLVQALPHLDTEALIRAADLELPDMVSDVVRVLARLADAPIPRGLVADAWTYASAANPGFSEARVWDLLEEAGQRLLMSWQGETVVMHALVRSALRSTEARPGEAPLREGLAHALLERFRSAPASTEAPESQWLIAHATALVASAHSAPEIQLSAWLGEWAHSRNDLRASLQHFRVASEAAERVLGAADARTVWIRRHLARVEAASGDISAASRTLQGVVAALEALPAPPADALAGALQQLGEVDIDRGEFGAAERAFERAVSTLCDAHGPDDPRTLDAEANLGFVAVRLGDLDRAEAAYTRALDGSRRKRGADHPDTLSALENLAGVLQARGDLAGARERLEQVIQARVQALGFEHRDTLTAQQNLAIVASGQGRHAEARALLERVLGVQSSALGPDHPITLAIQHNLAVTLERMGDFAAARRLAEGVLSARTRTLGPEHADTLSAENNLASLLRTFGDLASARKLYEHALAGKARIHGDEHPDTLGTMQNLANTMVLLGNPAEAAVLQARALSGLVNTVGPDHPSTCVTRYNLSFTLLVLGDREAARPHVVELARLRTRDPASLSGVELAILNDLPSLEAQVGIGAAG